MVDGLPITEVVEPLKVNIAQISATTLPTSTIKEIDTIDSGSNCGVPVTEEGLLNRNTNKNNQ